MEKHLDRFYNHCRYDIAKRLNHNSESLSVIAPILAKKIDLIYAQERNRTYGGISEPYYFSINKANNRLLSSMLKVIKQLEIAEIKLSEENIKSRLGNRLKKVSRHSFGIVLGIALNEFNNTNQ